ncbi:tyrosine-type recombinase/integrase [Streptosporangium sp. NPDC001681]|uniref:tyrosine-type recombinase/integrase n=1 Tax=Streptosporangium sp. NPDC001681 TaxID=3154395 RepID=UPI00331A82D4
MSATVAQVDLLARAGNGDGERIEGTTKSGRKRIVSLDDGTIRVLKAQRSKQAADKPAAGQEWRGTDDHVFTTGWGEPIHPDTVSLLTATMIRRYNNPAKEPEEPLPHARLHDLRHIHATTPLLAGVPVHVVAARLGHADPSITLRVYAHVIRAAETSAADVFAKMVER